MKKMNTLAKQIFKEQSFYFIYFLQYSTFVIFAPYQHIAAFTITQTEEMLCCVLAVFHVSLSKGSVICE